MCLADYTTDDGDASYTIDLFFFFFFFYTTYTSEARAVLIWCEQYI